jgi:hypothetical protein
MANDNYIKPIVAYTMTNKEKAFMHAIKKLKTPTNYASNLQKKVHKDGKLKGLKSHEYHISMQ